VRRYANRDIDEGERLLYDYNGGRVGRARVDEDDEMYPTEDFM
jgi:hypothetical protein